MLLTYMSHNGLWLSKKAFKLLWQLKCHSSSYSYPCFIGSRCCDVDALEAHPILAQRNVHQ